MEEDDLFDDGSPNEPFPAIQPLDGLVSDDPTALFADEPMAEVELPAAQDLHATAFAMQLSELLDDGVDVLGNDMLTKNLELLRSINQDGQDGVFGNNRLHELKLLIRSLP